MSYILVHVLSILISNLPFLSKILEKVVANQLCEFPQESNVY